MNQMNAEFIDLTPSLAAELLRKNSYNRPFSLVNLEKIKRSIRRCEWKVNGEAIIIFTNGDIGDGQHRCRAVVETGITIKTLIVRGVDVDVFGTIDSGKPRSASDVLSIKGELNTVTLASAARAYISTKITLRELALVTPMQLEDIVEMHPDIRFWTQQYAKYKKSLYFLPGGFCGFMAIASEKYGREKLIPFLEQLATGAGLLARSPALALRNRLMAQTASKNLTGFMKQAFIVKSINAFLQGKEIAILKQTEGDDFPKII